MSKIHQIPSSVSACNSRDEQTSHGSGESPVVLTPLEHLEDVPIGSVDCLQLSLNGNVARVR